MEPSRLFLVYYDLQTIFKTTNTPVGKPVIKTYRPLLLLTRADPEQHVIKSLSLLLLEALNDWPSTTRSIPKDVVEFKTCFGNPLTISNTIQYSGPMKEHWAWRAESGKSIAQLLELAKTEWQTEDFDWIVAQILGYYSREEWIRQLPDEERREVEI